LNDTTKVMTRYVQIDKSEMDAFMDAIGFHELSVRERTPEHMARQGRAVKEAVYESEPVGSAGGRIRIYSSVVGSSAEGKGRDVGEDAIRVQYWIGDQKITGSKRVHRTMNWRKNVLDRVEALRDSVATGPLSRIPKDSSGDYMVVRRYKGNEFWGSSNYPRIRETARFEAASVAPIKAETPVQKAMMMKWLMDDSERQEQVVKLQTMMKLGMITEDDVLEALMGSMNAEQNESSADLNNQQLKLLMAMKNQFWVGRYDAPYSMTSYGLGEQLGMSRSPVEKTLSPLIDRGLVERQKRHVVEFPRAKVWTYQITPKGQQALKWVFSAEQTESMNAQSYKPPASAVSNAKRGLKLRKEWGRGGLSPSEAAAQGIDSGVTRAKRIASGTVSEHDVRRMSAFNRHRKNYRPDKKESDGGPTAGTIAWLLWGGTSGVNWAKKKSAAMDAEETFVCLECGSDDLSIDAERQEVICEDCGVVYEDLMQTVKRKPNPKTVYGCWGFRVPIMDDPDFVKIDWEMNAESSDSIPKANPTDKAETFEAYDAETENPMRSAIIKGLRNAAKDGYVVAAPPYRNRSVSFYNNLAQIILNELSGIGTPELGPEVSGTGRAIDPYRVVADLASGRSVEIESPDDYSVGIADMITSFTQQSTIMDKNDGFIPPEGYTRMQFDLTNGLITRRLAWYIAWAMGIWSGASSNELTLYSTPQKNRNCIMIINMLLEELQPEVSSMTDEEKQQYYQEFAQEIMRQVGYYGGPLQEERRANQKWAEKTYGMGKIIDDVVVSAKIQEKARADASRLNPFKAETFEAYDLSAWNPFDEPSEEEAVWEQFYENLSSDDELVAKLWDLEGQPRDSAESWWDSLSEETGADDSFASTRQRLEEWEAVFERHYELIKEAAYRYWDEMHDAMAKEWENEREAREEFEERIARLMEDPEYTTLWDAESSVVEDGCPVCGDQLSQVSDKVLECGRCEIAWDLIVDEQGFEYLDSESDDVRDYGVGPTWM
jgi:DNA-binding MarR family transcriptional regulator/transcription elongation factor Elf1